MTFEVQTNEVGTHLSIKAAGQCTLAEFKNLFDRAKKETEKRGFRKVLLDISDVAGAVSRFDMFELGEHCARVWKLAPRIAIVSPHGELDKFFENVACNRGLDLAVFAKHDAALAYLKS